MKRQTHSVISNYKNQASISCLANRSTFSRSNVMPWISAVVWATLVSATVTSANNESSQAADFVYIISKTVTIGRSANILLPNIVYHCFTKSFLRYYYTQIHSKLLIQTTTTTTTLHTCILITRIYWYISINSAVAKF